MNHIRCAIYTRKSSEEGLDQSFNSLDAQREACEAYIRSQRHEGWNVLESHYDDGGFSGGNMERPALKRLMADIGAGKVNTVVVYKVDRLTRSLADFAKIIERFDAMQVSFVSVTQQFNTTNSMGRLTLNVLLSFAQFEREVTGERIRDKIAASKAKGMWMGGPIPVGYDLRDRKLYVNQTEAAQVRDIFGLYLKLRTVPALTAHLAHIGIRTKVRATAAGTQSGGLSYSRGAVYKLLRNHLYIGEIKHNEKIHRGKQEAIVDREIWDQVQWLLDENRQGGKQKRIRSEMGSLLTSRLFDEAGVRYVPTNTQKGGRRYRYYTSQNVIKGKDVENGLARVPAHTLETAVLERIRSFLQSPTDFLDTLKSAAVSESVRGELLRQAKVRCSTSKTPHSDVEVASLIHRVVVREKEFETQIRLVTLSAFLSGNLPKAHSSLARAETLSLLAPFDHVVRGRILKIVTGTEPPDPVNRLAIAKAITQARSWYELIVQGKAAGLAEIARKQGFTARYAKKIFPLVGLSPESIEHLLLNRGSPRWSLDSLRAAVPCRWSDQRGLQRARGIPADS